MVLSNIPSKPKIIATSVSSLCCVISSVSIKTFVSIIFQTALQDEEPNQCCRNFTGSFLQLPEPDFLVCKKCVFFWN